MIITKISLLTKLLFKKQQILNALKDNPANEILLVKLDNIETLIFKEIDKQHNSNLKTDSNE